MLGTTVKTQLPLSGRCVWLHIPSSYPDVVGLWLGTQNFERIAAVGVVGLAMESPIKILSLEEKWNVELNLNCRG